MDEEKSLDKWRFELKANKRVWPVFYQHMLGKPVTSFQRLYRLLSLYGDWALFEGIIDSSQRDLEGDALPYVTKVVATKWKTQQQQEDEDNEYVKSLKAAKEVSRKRNNVLARRIKKRGAK